MSRQRHLELIKQGKNVWNAWREKHRQMKPNLSHADLREADLSGMLLSDADFTEADLRGADLSEAHLFMAFLCQANLGGANLSRADLTRADLSQVELWKADLSGAKLPVSNLDEATLLGANLSGADLSGAYLYGADLRGANLIKANLSEANLGRADFTRANLKDADLRGANLTETDFTKADLTGAYLNSAILVKTKLYDANLTGCYVHGISAWNIQLRNTVQSNLIITDFQEPAITVDNLEVAQFIYLLLNNQKMRDVLNSVLERGVLILGRFGGGGLEVLHAIAAKLRDMRYLPIIFDFEKPQHRDFTETIMTLAGLSRFVIVDLSGPSVPNELRATIPHFKIPFVPIIEKGRIVYSMFPDLLGYPWVLSPVEFSSREQLMEVLPTKVIEPAEEKFKERQQLLNQLFNL